MTCSTFKFASIGSGSAGNCTVVIAGDSLLLIDCGFGIRETSRRLAKLGLSLEDVTAILVTHEHADHIKGVPAISRKFNTPVYMTRGTYFAKNYGRIPSLILIENYQSFSINGCDIAPVTVPHDAKEPAQYVLQFNGLRLGVLTDLGFITPHVVDTFNDCNALLVEANHDLRMLSVGPYPASLKERVSSNWGHLNNHQTADFLAQINTERLQNLVVGHISTKNNSVDLAASSIYPVLPEKFNENVKFACQDEGFDWIVV